MHKQEDNAQVQAEAETQLREENMEHRQENKDYR